MVSVSPEIQVYLKEKLNQARNTLWALSLLTFLVILYEASRVVNQGFFLPVLAFWLVVLPMILYRFILPKANRLRTASQVLLNYQLLEKEKWQAETLAGKKVAFSHQPSISEEQYSIYGRTYTAQKITAGNRVYYLPLVERV